MGGWTKLNLKTEVEDAAPAYGLSPNLEARFAREPLAAELVGLSYQRLGPNFRIPWGHTQKSQEEVYVLLRGSARARLGDEIVELRPWDALRVHKDTMRGFEAGADGAEFLVVGAPGGPGDAVVTQDWWAD